MKAILARGTDKAGPDSRIRGFKGNVPGSIVATSRDSSAIGVFDIFQKSLEELHVNHCLVSEARVGLNEHAKARTTYKFVLGSDHILDTWKPFELRLFIIIVFIIIVIFRMRRRRNGC